MYEVTPQLMVTDNFSPENELSFNLIRRDNLLAALFDIYWNTHQDRAEIRLCYPLVAMCAHDCIPNTFRCIDGRAERGGEGFVQD